jgi:hypothetical protein
LITWEIPIKTVSEANRSEHWHRASVRHRRQQFFVRVAFNAETRPIPIPCEITLVRIASRFLDAEDNLPMAFKWIKDAIGGCLFPGKVVIYKKKGYGYVRNKGHADSDPRVTWKYAQEKGKIQSIRIEIRPLSSGVSVPVQQPDKQHGDI